MQKLVYAILMTKRKLRHYFDAHPITVVSKYPLGEVIQNPLRLKEESLNGRLS
jgi:hypothetical protein